MRIINTNRSSRFKAAIFILGFLTLNLSTGCAKKSPLDQAQDDLRQSEQYYHSAVAKYKDLIGKGKDLDRLHFLLGQLYYSHGEFLQAAGEFKQSAKAEAKKFLGISFYRLGNITDALEVFSKSETPDDECLYYYGLTCENLNLYDKALDIYKKVKHQKFISLALGRINQIEKQVELANISELSPQVNDILANAPTEQDYPQAGALILRCDEKIEIAPQNTQVSYLHYVIKILNERGKEDFAESHIEYDSTFEKIELEYARTIKPDGTTVDVGSRHIRDVSKYLNFPLYSNARVYIISFPEVAQGACIEYKLKVYRHQLLNKKDFILSYPVQTQEPVISANFTVVLPKEKLLHIKTLNEQYNYFGADLKPKIKEESGQLIYTWQFGNVPQIVPEPRMPPSVEVNPTILISTFSSWGEIYDWWWPLAKDKIKADEAIKEKVFELTKGLESEEAKVMAIHKFCAQDIRYVAVEYGQAGHEPHFAGDIFKNKYGDCKDQAILLVTMLKEAGITAWPVLIPTKEYFNLNEDFPAVLFNHCIAAVSLEGKIIFLDPTAETCAFGDLPTDDQKRKVLVIKQDGYAIEEVPLYSAGHNLIRQVFKIKISPDETISGQKDVFSFGVFDQAQRFWLIYTQPELIEQTLKEKIQEISIGAKLDEYSIKNLDDLNTPVVLSYAFRGPEYFTAAGSLRIMPQLAALDTALVAKERRNYAIDFNILDANETILEFEIPSGFLVKYMPENVIEDNRWLKFSVEYSFQDNKVYFKQSRELKQERIAESEYLDFKHFIEGLAKKIKQRIVLDKTG